MTATAGESWIQARIPTLGIAIRMLIYLINGFQGVQSEVKYKPLSQQTSLEFTKQEIFN